MWGKRLEAGLQSCHRARAPAYCGGGGGRFISEGSEEYSEGVFVIWIFFFSVRGLRLLFWLASLLRRVPFPKSDQVVN